MDKAVAILKDFDALLAREQNAEKKKLALVDSDWFVENFTRWPRTAFHKEWGRFLRHAPGVSVLLAPREHAKTMQITVHETVWQSLQDPNFRTLIVSETDEMAVRMGRLIRSILESSAITGTFGPQRGPKWSANELALRAATLDEKEATITCQGWGGPVMSGHYDRVIMDDVVGWESSRTQLQRDKRWDWFKMTLYPVGARGQVWDIGTRYHFDDFHGRLLSREFWPGGCTSRIEKSLREDSLGNAVALWPEQYSVEALEAMRRDLGPVHFNAQYQNDVEAMKGSIFKAEWFRRYKAVPEGLRRYQGVDLAVGEKSFHNWFTDVTIGVEPRSGNIYVLGEYKGRLSFDQQYKKVQELYKAYNRASSPVIRVGVEANAYQAVLGNRLRERTRVPVKKIVTHKDKTTRALRMQGQMENGKIFFPLEGTEGLEEEMLRFTPDNDKNQDDLIDGFLLACEVGGVGGIRYGRVTRKPPGF